EEPQVCLLCVGGGPQLGELRRLADELGLRRQALFTGERPWAEMPDYYRIADVLVGNSSTETQGLTFIEALASGLPIVVRYNDCFDGIIEDGVAGSLFRDESGFLPAVRAALTPEGMAGSVRAERRAGGLAVAAGMSKETFTQKIETVYSAARDDRGKSLT
ncbi:MAG: glycosyltransferase, partial [Actinomycetes bacterium]|nr:glycosyltransferase [Actinomycetes bacterium]